AGFCYHCGMDVFKSFVGKVETAIINPLITLIALAAFVVFIWGVVEFIANAGNEEKRATGQQHMLWGFIGLVIIFGAKAIITIAANTFGIQVPAV
ncbi:MAG: seg, partial [Parcubacteria group bacterium]|nr:seg [Parcubacteria group bacterium]